MFKKYLGAASVLLAIASPGLLPAHAADSTDAKNVALVAQLTKLSDDWDAAIVRKDKEAIEANMAEDFRQIDGDGDLETKTSFVNGLVSDKLEIDPYKVEDFEIRLYGNVALLSGRTKMTGRYEGKPFKSHYRYIDIYAQRDGKWQIVSVQISRIPQQ
ncbi:nuclear transport factor 2 family protein [Undibacterium sp. TC9W]|uniref:nuclear transport factor 2 family protein n=1 Tax=Undibacterium sp. TC9W TaxID=3413053 RepID=UPI003BF11902